MQVLSCAFCQMFKKALSTEHILDDYFWLFVMLLYKRDETISDQSKSIKYYMFMYLWTQLCNRHWNLRKNHTIVDTTFGTKQRNQAKLDSTKKLWTLPLLNSWMLWPTFYFRMGDWALSSVSNQFWNFYNIF